MVGYDDDVRTRHLIYLRPDDAFAERWSELHKALDAYGVMKAPSRFWPHLTVLGFYSDFDLLEMDSRDSLYSIMQSEFNNIDDIVVSRLNKGFKIQKYSYYSDELVLCLEDSALKDFHVECISKFKKFIILKGGIPAQKDTGYFNRRYSYSMENYSAHVSVGEISTKCRIVNEYANRMIGETVNFKEVILSRRTSSGWEKMTSRNIL